MVKKIIILASGGGTNAENIIRFFDKIPEIDVLSVLCNRKIAGVYERVSKLNKPCVWFDADSNTALTDYCVAHQADLIVLAGYLKKIPLQLIDQFPNQIINIHPSLLPKFGGKGMYGMHVHKAVYQAGASVSGMTIHFVNAHYDEGTIIEQFKVPLSPDDTPERIAAKVQSLEYQHYPEVIYRLLS